MVELFESSNLLINRTSLDLFRSKFHTIDWDGRLMEINGARGVGKTTMLLQKAKLLSSESGIMVLYVSLDDPYFYKHNLIDLADEFLKNGGKYLFLDEVHRYPSKYPDHDWSSELKTIYDRFPDLKVVYSGSSILKLRKGKGDLSRRKITYNLPGLSFREYLYFNGFKEYNPINLDEIITNHSEISNTIISELKVLPQFKNYLNSGYYPFYKESPTHYYERLKDVISVILENDIPAVADLPFETSVKLKKLFSLISESAPYTPNLTLLGKELFISDQRTLLKYFSLLENAELIYGLSKEAKGNQILRKPNKVFLDNTNLHYCFIDKPDAGTQRETFFANQIRNTHLITYPDRGDFMIDKKFVVEIGGKNKTKAQIKDVPNSYLVIDDIETGFGNTIPLWLFGFLY
jgi:predicted AAA+ superfamily ATPase